MEEVLNVGPFLGTCSQLSMSHLCVREVDDAGHSKARYVVSSDGPCYRLEDHVRVPDAPPLRRRLLAVFLPTGYPATVSPDYTTYHIYNALQTFFSAIASLLASRAVLQGLGVGDESASATDAMLLSVLQESMGRVATIMFAHKVGSRIEAECKMYRLLADILNDTAMVSDCLSPVLPKMVRVPLLGMSSIFRALCGIAGGSSKATLSVHFARAANVGELNAKDASQETVVSLLGMWVGGVIVSHASSTTATWIWLLVLMVGHLATNYLAVSAVSVHSINRQRANIIFSSLMNTDHVPSPTEVAEQERIFQRSPIVRSSHGRILGRCEIGVPFGNILKHIDRRMKLVSSESASAKEQVDISEVCASLIDDHYILWIDSDTRKAQIVLTDRASVRGQLKAWSHAIRVMTELSSSSQGSQRSNSSEKNQTTTARSRAARISQRELLWLIQSTRLDHQAVFDGWMQRIEDAGWDTEASTSALETTKKYRIVVDE